MSVNLLILPGIGNSDAEHWQTLWQASGPAFSRIPQTEWDAPQCADWVRQLEASLQEKGPDTILVAHSLSCLLVAHWAPTTRLKPRAALLVAPPDPAASVFPPEALSFAQLPMMPLGFPALLVASENDPYASLGFAQGCAAAWGAEFVSIGNAGHINTTAGYGAWPQGRQLLDRLIAETQG